MSWPVFERNEYAAEVNVNKTPHAVSCNLLNTAFVDRNTGIDNEYVDFSVLFFYGCKTIGYLLFIRRIASNETSAYVTGDLLTTISATGNRYGSTIVDEIPGNCQSDATRTTCY